MNTKSTKRLDNINVELLVRLLFINVDSWILK